ncbi:uncharacterized protein J3D65DRAFT_184421 [Phyllosticta citribraziliensis]|uniref:Gfd2/YDR514C-like C-terminal domain-containing protein n=1 Tax=Phyllosticta citribraziliensis TaxID=989973 RepID=A0ABR1L1U9_9PEZI
MALSSLAKWLGLNVTTRKYRPTRQTNAQWLFEFGDNAGVAAHYTLDCLLEIAARGISDNERQKPAPWTLQNPPILVSVSTVEYEKDESFLMEIGMSILDLAAVRAVEPKDHCCKWLSQCRRSYHWIADEHRDKKNGDWIMDHSMDFPTEMGESQTLPLADIPDAIRRAIFETVPPHQRPSPMTDLPTYRPTDPYSVKIHLNEKGEIIQPFIDYKSSLFPVIADYGDGEVEDFEEVDDGSEIMASVCYKSLRGQKCKLPTASSFGNPFDVANRDRSRDVCNNGLHVCWDYAAERHWYDQPTCRPTVAECVSHSRLKYLFNCPLQSRARHWV